MLVIEAIYIIGGIPAIVLSGIFLTASLGIVGMALNLKRMPKSVFYKLKLQFNRANGWAKKGVEREFVLYIGVIKRRIPLGGAPKISVVSFSLNTVLVST